MKTMTVQQAKHNMHIMFVFTVVDLDLPLCTPCSQVHSTQRITFTTCASTTATYALVPDFEQELNLRKRIVFAPNTPAALQTQTGSNWHGGSDFCRFLWPSAISVASHTPIFILGLRIWGLAWHVSTLMIAFNWQHQPRMKDYSCEGRDLIQRSLVFHPWRKITQEQDIHIQGFESLKNYNNNNYNNNNKSKFSLLSLEKPNKDNQDLWYQPRVRHFF